MILFARNNSLEKRLILLFGKANFELWGYSVMENYGLIKAKWFFLNRFLPAPKIKLTKDLLLKMATKNK